MKKSILFWVTASVALLSFPLQAKAEWYPIGDGEKGPILMDDQSVYIKDDLRSAEVKYEGFGRATFVVNCRTYYYTLRSNYGPEEDRAAPGTVAGVIADEVCDRYSPRNASQ
jgi:hypothetical protein